MAGTEADRILAKLVKDVESAVHMVYRGEVRQQTAKARTDAIVREAQAALQRAMQAALQAALQADESDAAPAPIADTIPSPGPSAGAVASAGGSAGWSHEEGDAVVRCITGWIPMGSPKDAAAESKCVAAMRELTPTWGQREKAREAVRRISQP